MNFSVKKMFFIDLLITIIGVLFDQFTKHLAVLCLKDQAPVSLIPGALELRYLENRGAAFGILQNQKIFFVHSGACLPHGNIPCSISSGRF